MPGRIKGTDHAVIAKDIPGIRKLDFQRHEGGNVNEFVSFSFLRDATGD